MAQLLGSAPQLATFLDALTAANLSSISGEQLTGTRAGWELAEQRHLNSSMVLPPAWVAPPSAGRANAYRHTHPIASHPPSSPAVFAPSSAAFTAALLSGQLWESLAPSASEMRQLLLDHIVVGRRLTLTDLQQLAGTAGNASSNGGGAAVDDGGHGGAALQMASGRQALVSVQNGEQ